MPRQQVRLGGHSGDHHVTLLQCLSTVLEGTAWPTKHGFISVHIDSPKIISEELCQKYQFQNASLEGRPTSG